MTPLKLSTAWHRRYYEMSALVSLAMVSLFALSITKAIEISPLLEVDLIGGIAASVAFIASVVCLLVVKKIGDSFWPALAIFIVLTASTAWTIWQTGTLLTPFLGIWAILAFASAIFAVYGWLLIIALAGAALSLVYIDNSTVDISTILLVVISSVIPTIGSILIWREQKGATDEASRNAKTLASELSEVATKSEIIINAIGDGVIALDGKGTIELINPAAQEILGWGKQDAMMLHYKSVLKLNDENNHELDQAHDPVAQVLNTNQQTRANKLTVVTRADKRLSVSLVVSPRGDVGSGVIAVFRDVSKERAEEREQAEFISTASHEMRTPVASIEGYLGLALNPQTSQIDDKARGFLMKAHESAQHLGRLFQDLLDVSKSEDGRTSSVAKVVDLTVLAQTATEGLAHKAQEKGLRLYFKPNENEGQKKIMPVLYVNQDNDHIREILDNLIENAIKYTPKGEVAVDIEGTENKVIVSVKDSGLGIPAEDIPHLFQKFYRVDNVDRQEIGGTGLGLYLSRRLAESMQGRLWVESTFGQGSTFFLELPRIDSTEAAQLKEQQSLQAAQTQPSNTAAAPAFVPDMTPTTAPVVTPTAPAPAPVTAPTSARPATTVPRGESLTSEQKAARVKQLEELARAQRAAPTERQET